MIIYPDFPLSTPFGRNVHALGRTTSWIGSFLGKMLVVIALAAVLGALAGAALGFVVVVALI